MPKLKTVTAEELQAAIVAAEDASTLAFNLSNRLSQGYTETLPSPIQAASSFLSASGTLADLARQLILRAAMQENKSELEARLRAQQTQDKSK